MSKIEKAIQNVKSKVIGFKNKSRDLFEGKNTLTQDALKNATMSQKLTDKGIVSILQTVASTDVCSILNFVNQQTTNYTGFNPDKAAPPDNAPSLQKAKYDIQKSSYNIQKKIDNYYANYGDSISLGSNQAFINLAYELFSDITTINSKLGENKDLTKVFKIISLFSNYLQEIATLIQSLPFQLGSSSTVTIDFESNPNVLKLKNQIDNLRSVCVSIQNIPDSPQELAVYAFAAVSPQLTQQINELSKILDPKKLIPLIKAITNTCRSLYQLLSVIEGAIRFSQFIVTFLTVFVKIFSIIVKFLKALPLPSIFTTSGINTTFASLCQKIENTIKDFSGNLNQIADVLVYMVDFVEYVLIKLQDVLQGLDAITGNLRSCDNIDFDTLNNLNESISLLNTTKDKLNSFVSNYREKLNRRDNNFGDYTLTIVEENVVDQSITLKRRFGAALDKNAKIVAQTDLTFASLDSVIYEELKLKLVSLGLVKTQSFSTDAQLAISRATLFLEDDTTISSLPTEDFNIGIDSQNNEDESEGIGLNAFINKLNGGKRLRNRVRTAMLSARQKLNSDLASSRK